MRIVTYVSLMLVAVVGLLASPALLTPTSAIVVDPLTSGPVTEGPTVETQVGRVTDILLFIIGAAAALAIIYGGIKFATAGGDSSAVRQARNTVLYACIGLIVAILAKVIVDYIVESMS